MDAPSLDQQHRIMHISGPLAANILHIKDLKGVEGISSLFTFELELLSADPNLDSNGLLAQNMSVSLLQNNGERRFFNGIIAQFASSGMDTEGLTTYHATIVPWLWQLTLVKDCRIFQNLSPKEIIEKLFSEANFTDFEFRSLSNGQNKRIYCVQYRESTFDFISRLLEEEGIYYFFEHEEGKHTLVLADSPSQQRPCPVQSMAPIMHRINPDDDRVYEAQRINRLHTGKVSLTDYNFENPSTNLMVELKGERKYEDYDYPGGYLSNADGNHYARTRLESYSSLADLVKGRGNCRSFIPGHRFDLAEQFPTGLSGTYVLYSVSHHAHQSLSPSGESTTYDNQFSCFPHGTAYRPQCKGDKPRIFGSQTAKVVGKSGEEIWTDKHGRVKVQFHWDREGKSDEHSSCWVRVSHGWAGKQWGAFNLPRIGQEVIVDFLEGDPDRPIITGRVYNANNMPPYALPAEQTKTTFKSNSSKGGGGFNELRFEDKKGKEEIFVHGQKDWVAKILNNASEEIGSTWTVNIGEEVTIECGKASIHLTKDGLIEIKGTEILVESSGPIDAIASAVQTLKGSKIKLN